MRFARIEALYRKHFRDPSRERQFLASLSFFVSFAITRAVTHSFRARAFRGIWLGETHVHHLVWGILLLLVVGYAGMIRTGMTGPRGRVLAVLYGIGAALTLDEFALWLMLEDVYWERQGRASIDAVILFGALLSIGLWGQPFFRAVIHQLGRALRRGQRPA